MAAEVNVVLKDGPQYQIATPKYNREQSHQALMREATDKAREGFDPTKVRPRQGYVWGRIIDTHLPTTLARPDNAKATVRHWIETLDGRRLIFEYARGELIRTSQGEWLMVEEKYILAEEITGPDCEAQLIMMNSSILLWVEPLPTHTGALYDPSARQVQAEIGRVLGLDCPEPSLALYAEDRVAFIATAGTYCIVNGEALRIIHRDQVLGVVEDLPLDTTTYELWKGIDCEIVDIHDVPEVP